MEGRGTELLARRGKKEFPPKKWRLYKSDIDTDIQMNN